MRDDEITKIALANGFKLKRQADGNTALNAYVFDFARALLSTRNECAPGLLMLVARIREAAGDPDGKLMQDELVQRVDGFRRDAERIDKLEAMWPSVATTGGKLLWECLNGPLRGTDLRSAIDAVRERSQ